MKEVLKNFDVSNEAVRGLMLQKPGTVAKTSRVVLKRLSDLRKILEESWTIQKSFLIATMAGSFPLPPAGHHCKSCICFLFLLSLIIMVRLRVHWRSVEDSIRYQIENTRTTEGARSTFWLNIKNFCWKLKKNLHSHFSEFCQLTTIIFWMPTFQTNGQGHTPLPLLRPWDTETCFKLKS